MGLLRKGDFLPGGWIAQGLFRDLYNRHLKEGMDADAADKLAMTETFNMLEETQQSGRTYNTSALAREHGRLGRLLVQFATSPLQQLQYETQAWREWHDLRRYRPPTPDADYEKRYDKATGRLIRAFVINHFLLPAALHTVTNLYRLAMGQDPEWEQEGWHFTMFRDIMLGQASRIFFLGTLTSTLFEAMSTGKVSFRGAHLLPIEGTVEMVGRIGKTAHDIAVGTWHGITAKDFAKGFDYEKVQKDLHGLLRSTSITRTPYDIIRRATGHSDVDEKRRKESK
ncbi:MAG: hypothetical protein IKS67_02135 [Victivallales bacterium]|nr:hypothetical protein [Victivallales bacterium]